MNRVFIVSVLLLVFLSFSGVSAQSGESVIQLEGEVAQRGRGRGGSSRPSTRSAPSRVSRPVSRPSMRSSSPARRSSSPARRSSSPARVNRAPSRSYSPARVNRSPSRSYTPASRPAVRSYQPSRVQRSNAAPSRPAQVHRPSRNVNRTLSRPVNRTYRPSGQVNRSNPRTYAPASRPAVRSYQPSRVRRSNAAPSHPAQVHRQNRNSNGASTRQVNRAARPSQVNRGSRSSNGVSYPSRDYRGAVQPSSSGSTINRSNRVRNRQQRNSNSRPVETGPIWDTRGHRANTTPRRVRPIQVNRSNSPGLAPIATQAGGVQQSQRQFRSGAAAAASASQGPRRQPVTRSRASSYSDDYRRSRSSDHRRGHRHGSHPKHHLRPAYDCPVSMGNFGYYGIQPYNAWGQGFGLGGFGYGPWGLEGLYGPYNYWNNFGVSSYYASAANPAYYDDRRTVEADSRAEYQRQEEIYQAREQQYREGVSMTSSQRSSVRARPAAVQLGSDEKRQLEQAILSAVSSYVELRTQNGRYLLSDPAYSFQNWELKPVGAPAIFSVEEGKVSVLAEFEGALSGTTVPSKVGVELFVEQGPQGWEVQDAWIVSAGGILRERKYQSPVYPEIQTWYVAATCPFSGEAVIPVK